jgi:hypothetical protein
LAIHTGGEDDRGLGEIREIGDLAFKEIVHSHTAGIKVPYRDEGESGVAKSNPFFAGLEVRQSNEPIPC